MPLTDSPRSPYQTTYCMAASPQDICTPLSVLSSLAAHGTDTAYAPLSEDTVCQYAWLERMTATVTAAESAKVAPTASEDLMNFSRTDIKALLLTRRQYTVA